MAKQLKRIDAGGLQLAVLSDRCSRHDTPAQRAAKQKASSEAQKRMNQIYSYQKLELLLATNFPLAGSALVVTLTYDDNRYPAGERQADRKLRNFFAKLKADRRTAGLPDPVYFWCTEALSARDGRWHHHLVLDNTGEDFDRIRQCWAPYGKIVELQKLKIDERHSWESLARYMTKEKRECLNADPKPGKHAWHHSRNIKRPEVDTVTVPDDYQLEAPDNVEILLDEKKKTEFASYHILKYRSAVPSSTVRAPRAKRRRPPNRL